MGVKWSRQEHESSAVTASGVMRNDRYVLKVIIHQKLQNVQGDKMSSNTYLHQIVCGLQKLHRNHDCDVSKVSLIPSSDSTTSEIQKSLNQGEVLAVQVMCALFCAGGKRKRGRNP